MTTRKRRRKKPWRAHPTLEDVGKPKWLNTPDWNTLKALAAMEDKSCSEIMVEAIETVLVRFLLETHDPNFTRGSSDSAGSREVKEK